MQYKTTLNPITLLLITLVVLLGLLLIRNEANSQETESTTTVVNAPSGLYLSYQGQVLDNNGQPIDATLPMTFELFQTLTGGTACQSWSEAHSVTVTDGVFSVTLGQNTAIPDECLIDDIYLQLTINGETLSPREQLNMVANTLPASIEPRGHIKLGAGRRIYIGNAQLYSTGEDLFLNWHGGTSLRYGGGTQGDKFSVQTNGDGRFAGRLYVDGRNIHLSDAQLYTTGADMFINWHSGGNLRYGGGTERDKFWVDTSGNGYFAGNLNVGGSCTASMIDGSELAANECPAGRITTGAVVEGNLQTVYERQNGGNADFELGDLLCWSQQQLKKCDVPADNKVMGVADAGGNPIVLGAEFVKVIGDVEEGDYLVASHIPGYAIATKDPTFGIVIAQALEDFDGERGVILAMIRKM